MALSPMMQQYLRIKDEYPGTILFFRLGDFYEMFFEDAKLVSRELELTLTGKECGLEERAPMCGVPFHSVDTYLQRLIEKGYRVAICEQMSDPALSKGLVERQVTRIVTPGTVIETNMLEDRRPNYIVSVYIRKKQAGCALCDVSTGEFYLYQIQDISISLQDELARIAPSEIITNDQDAFLIYEPELGSCLSSVEEAAYTYPVAARCMAAHFGKTVEEMGFGEARFAVCAAGALLKYLTDTQKNALKHIIDARNYDNDRYLALDRVALRNLELTETVRGKSRKGSLLGILDRTRTAMGSRLMRSWIERPLRNQHEITRRQDAVEDFMRNPMASETLRHQMSEVYDVERLLSRIAFDSVNPRDCLALCETLEIVPLIQAQSSDFDAELIREHMQALDAIPEMADELRRAISQDAPLSVKEGGFIAVGYDPELDQLRDVAANGKRYLAELEQAERERTGIKNLKVGYNRVFGYYIEVTKSFYEMVPYHYVRKQTLANAERFITEELKELENRILGAEENAIRTEYRLFCAIRDRLKLLLPRLRTTAHSLKTLDVLLSMAQVASEQDYRRPHINDEGRYEIIGGRHPVVEESIGRQVFVPNDTFLDDEKRIMVITGPNMAGKSTYMRQVALIVLMAHTGSFVPAESADIGLTDRIFTRIGASDDLYGGQSTFMVEMNEMATILKYATSRSLLILDEVGRGTSTFDGLSIAWAAVEHIAGEKCGARTLFATHYHELAELDGSLPGVVSYRITAREQGEDVIFLRKIVPGGADRSYGVAVAKLAGLPKGLISRARQIMARLEVDGQANGSIGKSILSDRKGTNRQLGMMDFKPMELVQEICELDVVSMTPIDALNKLFELNEKAKRI
ncbi:MAG: DNA mismatch repair protein MutS [Christensenellales bacterium]|nr:DNA mismatch repair protein MutS [Christensenellales bacterium]